MEEKRADRLTVDFGIDLGTTNSAVAGAGRRGVQTIRNRYQQFIRNGD